MCLENYRKATKEEASGVGYKIFGKTSNGRITGRFATGDETRPIGKWINKDDFILIDKIKFASIDYNPGWHVYLRRPRLGPHRPSLCVKNVRFRKARLVGNCANHDEFSELGVSEKIKSVVADEIFIERAISGK